MSAGGIPRSQKVAEREVEVFEELSWTEQPGICIHEGGVCSVLDSG